MSQGQGDKEGVRARQVALAIVMQVHSDDAWASPVADRVLRGAGLDEQDRAFAANLAFSALRWEGTLDWVLGHAVTRGLDQVEASLLDILRIATWELLHGNQPVHAVLDSHVEVARVVVGQRATGFVNGVLRKITRSLEGLEWPDETTARGMGLRHGYPAWVAQAAIDRFGVDRAAAVLDAGNIPAPVVLRAVADRDVVLAALAEQGVDARPGGLARDAIVLEGRVQPSTLDVIADGTAIVQDQASQVVGQAAAEGLPPGSRTIDLCAAPGGKSTHLAQQGLAVTAVDRHAGRLRRAGALAARLGLAIDTVTADGGETGLPPGQADLVLVDAPCSGLGVVRRRPELRWRRVPGDVQSLAEIQDRLLRSAIGLVRPGGRVVYSVCTWTEQEADEIVAGVINDGLVRVVGQPDVGTPTTYGRQMAPDLDETDGMYVSVLERLEERS